MATRTYDYTLPTFLPDGVLGGVLGGREVDVRYCHEPGVPPTAADPCGTPACTEIWDVVDLADRSLLAALVALAPAALAGLEAECRADVEVREENRRRYGRCWGK